LSNEQLGATISERSLNSATVKSTLLWSGQADHSAVIALTAGRADLSANAGDEAADAATTKVAGSYGKLTLAYLQNRPLWGSTALRLAFTGQMASKNLDSSEMLSLGGLSGVRAYPNGEGLGDQGAVAQMEITFRPEAQWQFGTFVDYGWIERNAETWVGMSEPNQYHIQGAGVSATWQPMPRFSLQAIVAARLGTNPGANEVTGAASDGRSSRTRGWLVATWNF
jgi:hemolysin activation/secretion protein